MDLLCALGMAEGKLFGGGGWSLNSVDEDSKEGPSDGEGTLFL